MYTIIIERVASYTYNIYIEREDGERIQIDYLADSPNAAYVAGQAFDVAGIAYDMVREGE